MKQFYSIGEAAKASNVTSETLRHYDRIGLVQPEKKDEVTNYRYYTPQDLVRIQTVRALQQMDLPLLKIKEVLEYSDLEAIVEFLSEAEKKADEKMALLKKSKSKIRLAKKSYESQLGGRHQMEGVRVISFQSRVILPSDTLETPSLNNLWNYLSHFYEKVQASHEGEFEFEDAAVVYTEDGTSRMCALCIRHPDADGLIPLPEGNYLCAQCSEAGREETLEKLNHMAYARYHVRPRFAVEQIVVSGILNWNYLVQVPI